jgi:hypothetical protein
MVMIAVCWHASSLGQVLPVSEIKDPEAQRLQQTYISALRGLGAAASALRFPYPFYFSERLDIDESQQKRLPQSSIRFERFNRQIVLEITGNYYASYSADLLNSNLRARKTFQDVALPLLRVAVDHAGKLPIDAFGFEIAHHVRSRILKVGTEGPENLTVIIPRAIAERLAAAKDEETAQGALLESAVFLNGEPLTLWLGGDDAPADVKDHYLARQRGQSGQTQAREEPAEPGTLVNPRLIPESELLTRIRENRNRTHEASPARLESLQQTYALQLQRLLSELGAQAHFIDYAPPVFVAFRDGADLQLNMSTQLESPAGSSQYRIAALAFESHISHLLRPVSKYFSDNPQFDGIDFSTIVHQPAQPGSESVEFVVPLSALACFAKYDCTGQELINRSVVLINGERVTLDLERAESDVIAAVP